MPTSSIAVASSSLCSDEITESCRTDKSIPHVGPLVNRINKANTARIRIS